MRALIQTDGLQILDAGTRDSDSNPDTQLKAGLLLGMLSNGKYKHYDPTAKDGTEICQAYLGFDVDMEDTQDGIPADREETVFNHPILVQDIDRIASKYQSY